MPVNDTESRSTRRKVLGGVVAAVGLGAAAVVGRNLRTGGENPTDNSSSSLTSTPVRTVPPTATSLGRLPTLTPGETATPVPTRTPGGATLTAIGTPRKS